MSTKIYNAFKIESNSLDEVIEKIFNKKSEIVSIIKEEIYKQHLKEIINIYDGITLTSLGIKSDNFKNLDLEQSPHKMMTDKFYNRKELEKEDFEENKNDIEIQMIVYPRKITLFNKDYYLLQFFGESDILKTIEEKFFKDLGMTEYDYWDSTDQPDTITNYEWSLRKKHWDKLSIPILDGISITFLKEHKYNLYFDLIRENNDYINNLLQDVLSIKTKEQRVNKYITRIKEDKAYKKIYDKYIKDKNLENATKEELNEISYKKAMSFYFSARDAVKENDFSEDEMSDIINTENKIKSVLKSDFKMDDFHEKNETIQKNANKPKLKMK